MSDKKTIVAELISDLKQQRDEIRVRLHLGGQEVKKELSKLDDKLSELNHRFDPLKNAVGETSGDIWASLELLGGEVKEGFRRIYKSLPSSKS